MINEVNRFSYVLYVKNSVNVMNQLTHPVLREHFVQVASSEDYVHVKGYKQYIFNMEFENYGTKKHPESDNDCLQLAESIAAAKPGGFFFYRDKTPQLREIHTKKLFGESDKKNIHLAKTVQAKYPNEVNDGAVVKVGQVYAQVLTESFDDGLSHIPYHISTVILQDGDTNITLEANAYEPDDITERQTAPTFHMYSKTPFHAYQAPSSEMTVEPLTTFHRSDTELFNARNPKNIVTIVLEPA